MRLTVGFYLLDRALKLSTHSTAPTFVTHFGLAPKRGLEWDTLTSRTVS